MRMGVKNSMLLCSISSLWVGHNAHNAGPGSSVSAFAVYPSTTFKFKTTVSVTTGSTRTALGMTNTETSSETATTTSSSSSSSTSSNNDLIMPLNYDEMVSMAAQAVSDAYTQQGKTRQMVRLLLPRDPASGQLGQYFENDAADESGVLDPRKSGDLLLVPPDETWQGGIMQLYRAASPMCRDLLRRLSSNKGGIPPKITEDRSVDESGVDGIGLFLAQSSVSPEEDASCFVQPSQEVIQAIESISGQAGKRLVLLLNPQWRNTDDAFDSASTKGGFLGGLASRLGGKGLTLSKLAELGYESTYTIEGYVCKGGNIRILKRFDSDWVVFAENDAATDFIQVGSKSSSRPTYQEVDQMLDDKGISLKYARDIGLAPKIE
jgi:hypothetical protein